MLLDDNMGYMGARGLNLIFLNHLAPPITPSHENTQLCDLCNITMSAVLRIQDKSFGRMVDG